MADQLRISIGAAENRRLFPANFMEERLAELPGFSDLDAEPLRLALVRLWDDERRGLRGANEAQTEDRFIRPCLSALGFEYTVQAGLRFAGRRRQPDYALFTDEATRNAADAVEGVGRYSQAAAVLDAKRFERPLDSAQAGDALSADPVAQIIHYIQATRCPWGVLTNGRVWRLYALEGDLIDAACYEVDLIALLEGGDPEAFRYFAAFFAADAMRRDETGLSFLDRALADGAANARELGEDLERQVFSAVPLIAEGLLGGEERSQEALEAAFESSLVFLYRLLFCLHAEARGLLPVDEPHYFPYSVREQKQRLAREVAAGRQYSAVGDELFNELRALFRMIDSGDPRLGVNEYNGGLFSATRHPYFEGRFVPDHLLSIALDGLYRVDGDFVDYRSLSVRHLGTIYERLLDFRLVESDDGSLTLEPGEGRRDMGAYFTPEAIVDLIVERTLEPLLARRSAEVAEAGLTGEDALTSFLELKVLDPAMGSGHFLVSAASYVALYIATDPSYDGSLERSEIRRLVAERCLYGVDLNPMAVELARLALWLTTVKGDEPLTFLANLREGNALVGADVAELMAGDGTVLQAALARKAGRLLEHATELSELPSSTGDDVHEKDRIAAAASALRGPLEELADEQITRHFEALPGRPFHWQIEFPEVFLAADGSLRAGGGFDAVVGNPPYIRIQALGREMADHCRRRFESARGSFDAYMVFIEQAIGLLSPSGRLGFITPNKFMKLDSGERLRGMLTERKLIEEIIDFGDAQVFHGATNYTAILVLDEVGHDALSYARVGSAVDANRVMRGVEEADSASYESSSLGTAPWVLTTGDEADLLAAARAGSEPLSAVTNAIFTGLQTGDDTVYIVEDRGSVEGGRLIWCRADESEHVLENDLLHRIATGSDVDRFAFLPLDSLLIFPYSRRDGEMRLVDQEALERLPRTWAFLQSHEGSLRDRERGRMDHDDWWAFTYPKSLGLHDSPKLGVAATVKRLEVAIDPAGDIYFHNVRVNGILPAAPVGIWPLLAILNSRLLDFVFRRGAAVHANGYFAANRQFIAPLPIHIPGSDTIDVLTGMGESMRTRVKAMNLERAGFHRWLGGTIGIDLRTLPGRGAILAYDDGEFDDWLAALRHGARRLEVEVGSRDFREAAEREWSASISTLREMQAEGSRAERELDLAIYDLYEIPGSLRGLVDSEYD